MWRIREYKKKEVSNRLLIGATEGMVVNCNPGSGVWGKDA